MRIQKSKPVCLLTIVGLLLAGNIPEDLKSALPPQGPSPALSPGESQSKFQLAKGLRIELVASEPMVQDPVAMTFDENGRIWVVEMRGFMPDIDREGEQEPVGRISILEDTDEDGVMDRSFVFLDGLVLPRAVAIVRGGALVAEQKPLWFGEDSDGDGRADRKSMVDPTYGGIGMPEHSPNGLWRGIDNWYYNAKSALRYRFIGGKWISESTEFRGQWGISHDDLGRLFYNYNWSQLHADVAPPGYLLRNSNHKPTTGIAIGVSTNQNVFPIRPTTAVNRGYIPGALDESGRLRQFTAACAPLIYRGDAMPGFSGNAFVCEPAGNLVKRNIVSGQDLNLTSQFAHPNMEFLASSDERFRPVFLSDGPDGALYVVDMYRGVIQHGAYMTSYLRKESLARALDKPTHYGRIYRIVPEGWQRTKNMRMAQANSARLVDCLSDPNGWRRDTAQRLLVERNDRSVLPKLRDLARTGSSHFGRLHALWTLEGLSDAEPEKIIDSVRDSHPAVQAAAVRVLQLLSANQFEFQKTLLDELNAIVPKAPLDVRLQICLSAAEMKAADPFPILAELITRHADQPLMRDAVMSGLYNQEFTFLKKLIGNSAWQTELPGRAILIEMLAGAIARAGRQHDVASLFSLMDRPDAQFGWRERAVLAGLTLHADQRDFKPIQLPQAPAVLERLNETKDRALRVRIEKLRRILEWPGHQPASVARPNVRPLSGVEAKRFATGRQQYLTTCAPCHGADAAGLPPLGPPLLDSPWVLGSAEQLVRILLHGLEGPIEINGTRWEPPSILAEMPSLAVLGDESIAAVLTYIRREWNHAASPISPMAVSRIRVNTQGRQRPWTQQELEQVR